MKLGIVQMQVVDSVAENIANAKENILQLAKNGAQIIALPEMFCCPYSNADFIKNAQSEDGYTVSQMSLAAKENGVFLIAGSMPESNNGRIYNTSFVFSPSGEIIARHRKIHLFDIDIKGGQRFCESDTLSAGDSVTVFDTPYGSVGLCICFDMRFPELARTMARKGAQVIVSPAAFNMTTGPMHWELMFRSRAVDNQVFTVGVAPAQNSDASYKSYGHSIVVSPWGEVIKCAQFTPEQFIVDLNLDEVSQVRAQLPLTSALRPDVYK